jgi:replicative DNA helicase
MELTEIVPTTANVFEYAQIVKNKSVLRGLIKAGNAIIAH